MKQTISAILAIVALALFTQTSCFYDNEEDRFGTTVCDTAAISFSQDVLPIINARCISCHAPGGEQEGSPFTNYAEIKNYDASIVERVNGIGSIMPPTGAISDCEQQKLEAWLNAGSPNN